MIISIIESKVVKSRLLLPLVTPTEYKPVTNYFNTSSVESVAKGVIEFDATGVIIVKSTIPTVFKNGLQGALAEAAENKFTRHLCGNE